MSSNQEPGDGVVPEVRDQHGARAPRAESGAKEGLSGLFERQAATRPNQVAVVCGGERMTYRELDERANQMARFLQARGVRRGDRVAFLLPRSLDVYIALLGILKAGAAYVPLDPESPPSALASFFRIARLARW